MTSPDEADAYNRGLVTGAVEARLSGHDQDFATMNSALERANELYDRLAGLLAELTLAVQRLNDQSTARDATVLATATALREAEAARRTASEQSWSPLARASLILGVLLGAITLVSTLYLLVRR